MIAGDMVGNLVAFVWAAAVDLPSLGRCAMVSVSSNSISRDSRDGGDGEPGELGDFGTRLSARVALWALLALLALAVLLGLQGVREASAATAAKADPSSMGGGDLFCQRAEEESQRRREKEREGEPTQPHNDLHNDLKSTNELCRAQREGPETSERRALLSPFLLFKGDPEGRGELSLSS